jgi:GDPmannose 4,6-dehydratase
MVQHETPDDYVVATGETYSVRQFLDVAFKHIEIDDWDSLVVIDPKFYRPAEVDYLLGIPAKAKRVLGWEPQISFKQLVERMVNSDVEEARLQRSDLQRV